MGRLETGALQVGRPAKGREEASSPKWLRPAESPAASRPRGVYLITYPGPSDPSERVGQSPSSSLSRRQGVRYHVTDETGPAGSGDPRAHLCGLGRGAGRGETYAHLGALIPQRSRSGNGECLLQANAGVQARARQEGTAVPGRAPDHREDGRTDTGRLPALAARSTWSSG